jgi:hypothetical protein
LQRHRVRVPARPKRRCGDGADRGTRHCRRELRAGERRAGGRTAASTRSRVGWKDLSDVRSTEEEVSACWR